MRNILTLFKIYKAKYARIHESKPFMRKISNSWEKSTCLRV